ncbi:DUF4190 domain-containing protein [Alkalihalobacillus sp. 1P02AB]|uniref:DUF4190 domain-containing protein n=1 Tax=Alkalihalobacillus sp. 1P02AB TaxID=3132260 RepID=UPI0039A57B1C
MEKGKEYKTDPVRLVDDEDPSLTFLNTHADGRRDTRPINEMKEDTSDYDESHEPEPVHNDQNGGQQFNEETAAEYAALNGMSPGGRPFDADQYVVRDTDEEVDHVDVDKDTSTSGRGIGTFAFVLSFLSLFFLPVLLGAAGIVVGFVSRHYGAKALGNWAIGLGAISILLTLFFSPFF